MPVAHALTMAREDVEHAIADLETDALWARLGGGASAGFHALHLAGSLDRLFTYARDEQFRALEREKSPPPLPPAELIRFGHAMIDRALAQLRGALELWYHGDAEKNEETRRNSPGGEFSASL